MITAAALAILLLINAARTAALQLTTMPPSDSDATGAPKTASSLAPSLTHPQHTSRACITDPERYEQSIIVLSMCLAVVSLMLVGLVAFFIYRRCTFRTTTRRVPAARSA